VLSIIVTSASSRISPCGGCVGIVALHGRRLGGLVAWRVQIDSSSEPRLSNILPILINLSTTASSPSLCLGLIKNRCSMLMDEQAERPAGPQCHPIKLINGSRTNTAAWSKNGGHQVNEPSNRQRLCEVCQSIKLQAPPYWWQNEREGFSGLIIPHYPSHSMLLASASSGCPFCIMIARALDRREVPPDCSRFGDRNIHLLWYRVEGSTYRKGGREKTWGVLEATREKMGVYEGDPSRVPADYLIGTMIAGGPLRVHAEKGELRLSLYRLKQGNENRYHCIGIYSHKTSPFL
jgi:hypothetical protein